MHRKRVTPELHDSYFRLMTIKHPISKIQLAIAWALSYYLTQLSLGCKKQLPAEFQTVETRCGREGHTRPRGHSENPRCSCQQNSRQPETRCGREGHTRPRGHSENPRSSCQQTPRGLETRCGREGHTRPRGTSENPRSSCQQTPRGLETRCGREGHTRPRGPSESPDGVDPNIRRTIKTQRDGHNSGVKI